MTSPGASHAACLRNAVYLTHTNCFGETSDNTAEIRRMRVGEEQRRRGVGSRLLEEATTFCRSHGYLKVVLDVRIERAPAIAMFKKFGFHPSRAHEHDSHQMMDFYLDLYSDPTV